MPVWGLKLMPVHISTAAPKSISFTCVNMRTLKTLPDTMKAYTLQQVNFDVLNTAFWSKSCMHCTMALAVHDEIVQIPHPDRLRFTPSLAPSSHNKQHIGIPEVRALLSALSAPFHLQ